MLRRNWRSLCPDGEPPANAGQRGPVPQLSEVALALTSSGDDGHLRSRPSSRRHEQGLFQKARDARPVARRAATDQTNARSITPSADNVSPPGPMGRRKRVLRYVEHLDDGGAEMFAHACRLRLGGSFQSAGTWGVSVGPERGAVKAPIEECSPQ